MQQIPTSNKIIVKADAMIVNTNIAASKELFKESPIKCKHCGKRIEETHLIGFSLICPLCGKPQNGQPHLEKLH